MRASLSGCVLLSLLLLGAVQHRAHAHKNSHSREDAVAYSTEDPQPTGKLRVASPTIAWRVVPHGNSQVTSVTMTLNGLPVTASWLPERYTAAFTPDTPLAPGKYAVHCTVILDRTFTLENDWEFSIAPDAVSRVANPDTQQKAVGNAVSILRRQLGLPEVTLDSRLCAAALGHSAYLSRNGVIGHDQIATLPGFVGASCEARIAAFGYAGNCLENVSLSQIANPVVAVRRLFDAPYHRAPFLQPGTIEVGAGFQDGVLTLLFGTSDTAGVVTYPLDGQKDVPLSWDGVETPDPLRLHPQAVAAAKGRPVGYPITLHAFGGVEDPELRLQNVRATMTTRDGRAVTAYVNSPDNDDELQSGVLLIPVRPLLPGTEYVVRVEATDQNGVSLVRTWSFTTAKPVKPVVPPRTNPVAKSVAKPSAPPKKRPSVR